MPKEEDFFNLFKSTLRVMLLEAMRARDNVAEIDSAELLMRVPLRESVYKNLDCNRICREVMRREFSPDAGDTIVELPDNAGLTIRYVLPRPEVKLSRDHDLS